jgi:hypothetical protein
MPCGLKLQMTNFGNGLKKQFSKCCDDLMWVVNRVFDVKNYQKQRRKFAKLVDRYFEILC